MGQVAGYHIQRVHNVAQCCNCLQPVLHYLTVHLALEVLLVYGVCNLSELTHTIRLQLQRGPLLTGTMAACCMQLLNACITCAA